MVRIFHNRWYDRSLKVIDLASPPPKLDEFRFADVSIVPRDALRGLSFLAMLVNARSSIFSWPSRGNFTSTPVSTFARGRTNERTKKE
jgi:hypothetical protein